MFCEQGLVNCIFFDSEKAGDQAVRQVCDSLFSQKVLLQLSAMPVGKESIGLQSQLTFHGIMTPNHVKILVYCGT